MATWHQAQARKRGAVHFWHETKWTVYIDPPNQMTGFYLTSTRELAEVYLRNLQANNPGAARYACIIAPSNNRAK